MREVEKVLGALERKEAARSDVVAEQAEDVKPQDSAASSVAPAPVAVDQPAAAAAPVGEEEPKPEPLASSTPAPAETPFSDPAPVFIPIGSPTPAPSRTLPDDDDARSDVSSLASPLLGATAALDDDARSATSSRSSSSSRHGCKAYVEDAPEEDGFQMM